MRWRITILRQTLETGPPFDERLNVWYDVLTCWAEKIHKSEDEKFAASQRYASRVVTFRTRWLPIMGDGVLTERKPLIETDRIRCDGLVYDIKGIRELGFRRGLEIAAEYQS